MSIKKGLVAAFSLVGLKAPVSLKDDITAAVAKNDAAEIASLAALSPELVKGVEGLRLLEDAVLQGKKAAAEALVKANPELPTLRDNNGATLLMLHARAPASKDSFELLLGLYKPEELLLTDKHGNTITHYAAREQGAPDWDIVNNRMIALSALAPLKLDVNLRNDDGDTPLIELGRMGGNKGVDILLSQGAQVNDINKKGVNATMNAIRSSNLSTATELMGKGGKVDFSDPAINTQVSVASYDVNIDFLKALDTARKGQGLSAPAVAAPAVR